MRLIELAAHQPALNSSWREANWRFASRAKFDSIAGKHLDQRATRTGSNPAADRRQERVKLCLSERASAHSSTGWHLTLSLARLRPLELTLTNESSGRCDTFRYSNGPLRQFLFELEKCCRWCCQIDFQALWAPERAPAKRSSGSSETMGARGHALWAKFNFNAQAALQFSRIQSIQWC